MLYPTIALIQERKELYQQLQVPGTLTEGSIPEDLLQRALANDPNSSFWLSAAGNQALDAGDLEAAAGFIARGMNLAPHLPNFYFLWADLLNRTKSDAPQNNDARSIAFELAIRKADLHFDSWTSCLPEKMVTPDGPDLLDWAVVGDLADKLADEHQKKSGINPELERLLALQDILNQSMDGVVDFDLIEKAIADRKSVV